VDIQFLRIPLRDIVEDEAAIDFLLDEVGKILLNIVFHGDVTQFSYENYL